MKKLNNIKEYIKNIFIVLTIIFICLFIQKIYPFSSTDQAIYDANFQYKPMLYNFITAIKNGTLETFNFSGALGTPTVFNFLYYLASPINLIALLFNSAEAMFFSVTIIKVIIATITSTFYAKKRTNNPLVTSLCSIGYVFCTWFIAYSFNIMWLDAFMIFPLFQYGLEELFNNKKYNIYIFTLSYIFYTNFYLAFIICIYTLIYFIYNLIIEKSKIKDKILKLDTIAIATLVTFALSTTALYLIYTVFTSKGIAINTIEDNHLSLKFFSILKGFFYGNSSTNLTSYGTVIPNISLSIIFLISILYYFANSKITIKEKITTLIAITFTCFVFTSNQLDYIINCFHVTAGYNFRYSFIFSFYTIIIFIRNFKTFDHKIEKRIYIINILILILDLILFFYKQISKEILTFNIFFLITYTLLFIFYKKNNKIYQSIFLLIFAFECGYCYYKCLDYNEFNTIHNNKEIKNYEYRTNTKEDFATEYLNTLYKNEKSLITFSSMLYDSSIKFLDLQGCATDIKATIFTCDNNDVFNMIYNIKDKNNYYLPKLYAVDKNIYLYNYDNDNFIDNHNNMIQGMTGIEKIINPEEIKYTSKEDLVYKYKIKKDNVYQLLINLNLKYIVINNTVYTSNINYVPKQYKDYKIVETIFQRRSILFEASKNDIIEISYFQEIKNENLTLYTIDNQKYEKAYNYLKEGQIKYTTYKDDYIEGKITVKENQLIFTSIPYDKNWEIKIDNKKVEAVNISNALIGIECEPGTHTITMKYKINITIPLIISLLTLTGLLINIFIKQKKNEN